MSGAFSNLEESLRKHLPDAELKEVKRILYGRSDEYIFIDNWNRLIKLIMFFLLYIVMKLN